MTVPGTGPVGDAPARLDTALVRRGIARSREQALELLAAGAVLVDGKVARKASAKVAASATLSSTSSEPTYVSRGAHKLVGALADHPSVQVEGRRCLDAGASTGGFTDVLLRSGAAAVVALDVGSDQLAASLRDDPRVGVVDATNVRDVDPDVIGGPVDLVVADLSFISLVRVLDGLVRCARPDGDLLLLVKPQFEVGKGRVGAGGVVRDPERRAEAVEAVAAAASERGLGVVGSSVSRLPGPAGNLEYFLHLRRDAGPAAPGSLTALVLADAAERAP